MVMDQFKKQLLELRPETKVHVTLGDLFDASYISPQVLLTALSTYEEAMWKRPDVKFYILQGNHDLSKEIGKTAAFHVLAHIFDKYDNITVVKKQTYVPQLDAIFLPWQPDISSVDAVEDMPSAKNAVVHFDMEGTMNSMPHEEFLRLGVTDVFCGHIHQRGEVKKDGITYHLIGSMQPYAFDQDTGQGLYVKVSLKQLQENPEEYKNKVVRVELEPDEEMPSNDFDCLSLQVVRSPDKGKKEVKSNEDVIDISNLLNTSLKAESIDDEVVEEILSLWSKRSNLT